MARVMTAPARARSQTPATTATNAANSTCRSTTANASRAGLGGIFRHATEETTMRPITPDTVLAALSRHIGAANGVRADALVGEITGGLSTAQAERALREIVVRLRNEGHPVCAHPPAGYILAANDGEQDATSSFLFE